MKKTISFLTALALCLSLCPTWAFAAEPDTGFCAHNMDECRICPIEDALAALPRALTEDNAETVRWQLDEILDLWRELSEDEQGQIDLKRCWDLQAALDEANVPAPIDEPPANALAEVRLSGGGTIYPITEAEFWAVFEDNDTAGAETTVTLLADVAPADTINIWDGTFTLDLNGKNINFAEPRYFSVGSDTWNGKDGGNLTIRGSGTVQGSRYAVRVDEKGTVTLEGSAFLINQADEASVEVQGGGTLNVSNAGVEISHLYAGNGSQVSLTSGTYGEIQTNSDRKPLSSLLGKGCAYYRNGSPIALAALPDGASGYPTLTGPVTVVECTHDGAATPNDDGATHGGDCPYCGKNFDAATHTLGADNKCEGCGTPLVASVKIGDATTYYGKFTDAWNAASGKTATVTLLADVTETGSLSMSDGDIITLNGGSHTLSVDAIEANGGQLNISSGTFSFVGGGLTASDGTVRLSGGEFISTTEFSRPRRFLCNFSHWCQKSTYLHKNFRSL